MKPNSNFSSAFPQFAKIRGPLFPNCWRDLRGFNRSTFWALCLIGVCLFCPVALAASLNQTYQEKPPSFDGTGRVYMGREIAQVMGHEGAQWLERPSRLKEEAPDKLVQLLSLSPQDSVADIGAGTGYMSFRLAKQVPRGHVFAVDIQPEMLERLRISARQGDVNHVIPIQGSESAPNLEPNSIDLALMVDVYHELAYPHEMLLAIAKALKPNGHLVLAEYKAENPLVLIKPLHKMSQPQIKAELQAAGFFWDSTQSLPQQHLMTFHKA